MPPHTADAAGNRKITSFFAPFVIPKEYWLDSSIIEEEIVVATPQTGRKNLLLSAESLGSSTGPESQKRRRRRKHNEITPIAPFLATRTKCNPSTKSPMKFNVNPIDGAADITPTPDSPYRAGCTPARGHRLVAGVLLSRQSSPIPPASSPLTNGVEAVALSKSPPFPARLRATRSQNAFVAQENGTIQQRSTSQGPQSSIASADAPHAPTSSRRIVKNGIEGIANSDSDTNNDSSTDELADPRSLFGKRRKGSTEPAKSPTTIEKVRSFKAERPRKSLQTCVESPPEQNYKHSLSSITRQAQLIRESEASSVSIEQAIQDLKKEEEEAERRDMLGMKATIGAQMMLGWGSDNEDGERRLKALRRVEALHAADTYHFFLDTEPLCGSAPFPFASLPPEPWSRLFATDFAREQACISGFAAEMAAHFPLPMAVTNWMAQQLHHEQNEALCEAYVHILRQSSAHHESISDTIASLSSLYMTRSLSKNHWKEPRHPGLPSGLRHSLKVVQICASASDGAVPGAEPSKSIEAFLDLALLNFDEFVRKDIALSLHLADCIENLLDLLPEHSFLRLVEGVVSILRETDESLTPRLRCQLIASLPSRTARTYQLRRQLALDTFITPAEQSGATTAEINWLDVIHRSLRTKEDFAIRGNPDYKYLLLLIEVLDIAISAGSTNHTDLHPAQADSADKSAVLFAKPPALSQAAKKHNSQIDTIISELEYMKGSVQHEATHIQRQKVKAALDRLITRLETTVRTRPKPKRSVFGDGMRQAQFDRTLFQMDRNGHDSHAVTANAEDDDRG